jgi:hypothetical protein
MQKVLEMMVAHCELGPDSVFIDIGSGDIQPSFLPLSILLAVLPGDLPSFLSTFLPFVLPPVYIDLSCFLEI